MTAYVWHMTAYVWYIQRVTVNILDSPIFKFEDMYITRELSLPTTFAKGLDHSVNMHYLALAEMPVCKLWTYHNPNQNLGLSYVTLDVPAYSCVFPLL